MTQAYPLQWPDGWPRTPAHKRIDGEKFKRGDWKGGYKKPTTYETRVELANELQRLGAKGVILSTNIELRLDGLPYSNRRAPDDPGIAVYFTLSGEAMVMAQDQYRRVPDNIRSLTLAIAGMRQMQRHGGGTMLKRAFAGFAALPPPNADFSQPAAIHVPPAPWWQVLEVAENSSADVIKAAYRAKSKTATEADQYTLNAAYEAWKKGA